LLLELLLLLLELELELLLLDDSDAKPLDHVSARAGRATREQLRSIAIVDVATRRAHDLAAGCRELAICTPDCAQI